MELGLADKVVIVTGAASGIGAAVARALLAEGAALLLLTDRDDAGCRGLAAALGVASITADLTDPDAPTPRRPDAHRRGLHGAFWPGGRSGQRRRPAPRAGLS